MDFFYHQEYFLLKLLISFKKILAGASVAACAAKGICRNTLLEKAKFLIFRNKETVQNGLVTEGKMEDYVEPHQTNSNFNIMILASIFLVFITLIIWSKWKAENRNRTYFNKKNGRNYSTMSAISNLPSSFASSVFYR